MTITRLLSTVAVTAVLALSPAAFGQSAGTGAGAGPSNPGSSDTSRNVSPSTGVSGTGQAGGPSAPTGTQGMGQPGMTGTTGTTGTSRPGMAGQPGRQEMPQQGVGSDTSTRVSPDTGVQGQGPATGPTTTGPSQPQASGSSIMQPGHQPMRGAAQPGAHQGRSAMGDQPGGMSQGGQGQMRLTDLPPELRQSVQSRMAPNQRVDELIQTTLLNQLGRLGFSQLNSMRRDGNNYVAEVVTVQGQPATYRIDPSTGEMTQLR